MSRRRGIALLIAGVLLITIGVFVWGREREPEYQGKPLRYWIHGTSSGMWEEAGITESPEEVLRKMGPEVVPWLVRWLQARDGQPSKLLSDTRDKLPYWIREHLPETESADELNWLGLRGLHHLGPAAHEALPTLEETLHDADVEKRVRAAYILADMGYQGLPALVGGMRSRNREIRSSVFHAIQQAAWLSLDNCVYWELLPFFVAALHDQDELVRLHAAQFILQLDPRDAEALRVIMALVKEGRGSCQTSAIMALYGFEAEAQEVIPTLVKIVEQGPKHQGMSCFAMSVLCLGRMGSAAREAVPVVSSWLTKPGFENDLSCAEALGKIGPDAREAIPALRTIVASPHANPLIPITAAKALWRIDRDTNAVLALMPQWMARQQQWLLNLDGQFGPVEDLEILGEVGPAAKAAVPAIQPLLQARSAGVRSSAERALQSIDPDGTWRNGSPGPPPPPDPGP
jgi:hypothetical protein